MSDGECAVAEAIYRRFKAAADAAVDEYDATPAELVQAMTYLCFVLYMDAYCANKMGDVDA